MENWNGLKLLGKGSHGTVFLAASPNGKTDHDHNHNHHNLVAVKVASMEYSSPLVIERKILRHFIGCPEIVQCIGSYITTKGPDSLDPACYNLVLEYAAGGSLADMITLRKKLPEREVREYLRMILRGLSWIHGRGFVHGDLKPDNILVFPEQGMIKTGGSSVKLKIADFGLSKKSEEMVLRCNVRPRFRGTPKYMSPESVVFGKVNYPLDIWSLGCILIKMVSGKSVWSECGSLGELMKKLVYEMEIPDIPEELCREGRDFLARCIDQNYERRWTAEMLLEHPYLKEEYQREAVDEIIDAPPPPPPLKFDLHSPCSLFMEELEGFHGSCFELNPKDLCCRSSPEKKGVETNTKTKPGLLKIAGLIDFDDFGLQS